jgi:hypothetical protein
MFVGDPNDPDAFDNSAVKVQETPLGKFPAGE